MKNDGPIEVFSLGEILADEAVEAATDSFTDSLGKGFKNMRAALTAALEAEIRAGRAFQVAESVYQHGYWFAAENPDAKAIILRIETDKDKGK